MIHQNWTPLFPPQSFDSSQPIFLRIMLLKSNGKSHDNFVWVITEEKINFTSSYDVKFDSLTAKCSVWWSGKYFHANLWPIL